MERFEANKVLKDRDGNRMETMMWDFYSTGEPILCMADEDSIYPAREFDPRDWEVVKEI